MTQSYLKRPSESLSTQDAAAIGRLYYRSWLASPSGALSAGYRRELDRKCSAIAKSKTRRHSAVSADVRLRSEQNGLGPSMDQSANHDLAALQQRAAAADCMIRTQRVVMNQKDVLTLGGYIQQLADGRIPRATGQLSELLRRAGV